MARRVSLSSRPGFVGKDPCFYLTARIVEGPVGVDDWVRLPGWRTPFVRYPLTGVHRVQTCDLLPPPEDLYGLAVAGVTRDQGRWFKRRLRRGMLLEIEGAASGLAAPEEEEHFDGEKIPGGSNRVFNARITIRDQIQRSKFVGARKTLGRALHAIQDFYAHTNWIHVAPAEMRWSSYENRIGQLGAFADGTGRPRMARPNEPQCLEGYALLIERPQGETDELVRRYVNAEARGDHTGLVTSSSIRAVLADRPLTSGYYYDPRSTGLRERTVTRDGDLGEIIDTGKCRHGWAISLVRHEGINKDEPGRNGYEEARAAALRHTTQFKDGFTDMIDGR
jgi:hypothetical protein